MKRERPQFQYLQHDLCERPLRPIDTNLCLRASWQFVLRASTILFYRFYYFTIRALRKQDANYLAIVSSSTYCPLTHNIHTHKGHYRTSE